MRSLFTKALALPLLLALASPGNALEKSSRQMTAEPTHTWAAATTVTIAYYNNCTGWVWTWSGWSPGEALGVCYDSMDPAGATLNATWALTFTPAPSGYGFTGTISVEDKCDCTGSTLASQPYLAGPSGWNATAWAVVVPQTFLVKIDWVAPSGLTVPTGLASDHPFAGPTGPTACGTCFPTTRAVRTTYYGVGGASCPGTTLSDGLCDIEMMWSAAMKTATSVDEKTWGQVKALYN
ncbi:MAG: hypothetical protein HKN12_08330 [Gemmatimonadetes bacterium]|nr:hypothetical protein [Gemmatimonadota bacterium]